MLFSIVLFLFLNALILLLILQLSFLIIKSFNLLLHRFLSKFCYFLLFFHQLCKKWYKKKKKKNNLYFHYYYYDYLFFIRAINFNVVILKIIFFHRLIQLRFINTYNFNKIPICNINKAIHELMNPTNSFSFYIMKQNYIIIVIIIFNGVKNFSILGDFFYLNQ